MKRVCLLGILIASMCLPVFAAKTSDTFDLPWKVTLGDAELPAGRCEVTWTEPSGSQVQLTIKASDKKSVTVPATVVEGKAAYTGPVTSVVDGVRYLKGFRTKDATITIDGPGAGTR